MQIDEVIENLEIEVLWLLKQDSQKLLKVEVSPELYIELEQRAYFRCNHSTVCQIWQGLPIEVCHYLGKPYDIKIEPKPETINLFKSDEIAIPRYNAPFRYHGM